MAMTIQEIVHDLNLDISKGKPEVRKHESMTSLCGLLFNGGCLIYSDLQATSTRGTSSYRSSTRESKIYRVDDTIALAGTGAVTGIINGIRNIRQVVRYWRAEHGLKPLPPQEAGEIFRAVLTPGDEAWYIMAGYDRQRDQGFAADVDEDGTIWKSHIYQVDGSGAMYMLDKAKELEEKVLSTVDRSKLVSRSIIDTRDLYTAMPYTKFGREVAMLEGLNIINAGPTSDVFSGGNGFQLMVVTRTGIDEYLLPKQLAQEIIEKKRNAEFSVNNPKLKLSSFRDYLSLFEQGRRKKEDRR